MSYEDSPDTLHIVQVKGKKAYKVAHPREGHFWGATKYAVLDDTHTLFPQIESTDAWMLEQLATPSGSWEDSACPEPNNKNVQAWWYALLLGASSVELKDMLSMASPAPTMELGLPSELLVPP